MSVNTLQQLGRVEKTACNMLTVVALGVNTEALEDGETTQSLKAINLL